MYQIFWKTVALSSVIIAIFAGAILGLFMFYLITAVHWLFIFALPLPILIVAIGVHFMEYAIDKELSS